MIDPKRTALLLAIFPLLLSAGCLASGGRGARPEVSSLADARRADALVQAKARFDSIARAGGAASASLMLPDGVVQLDDNETFSGPRAIQEAFARVGVNQTLIGLGLVPEVLNYCDDGVYERAGTYTAVFRSTAAPLGDSVRGRYDARWEDAQDGLRIRTLRIAPGEGPPLRSWRRGGCTDRYVVEFTAREWRISVLPFVGAAQSAILRSIEPELRERSWGPGRLRTPEGVTIRGWQGSTQDRDVQVLVSVRRRLRSRITVGVEASPYAEAATVRAFSAPESSYVTMGVSRWRATAMLGAEWRYARVAAGPGVVRASASTKHHRVVLVQGRKGPEYFSRFEIITSQRTSTRPALAAEGALLLPMGAGAAFELAGHLSAAPVVVPAAGPLPSFEASRAVGLLTLGVQLAR